MASFGKISNSLIQGTNENTFALASINFDFSLVSLTAPSEFAGLGKALAPNRRENAEHGALHRTARKLGALFEGVIPPVPLLFSAYGTRASEIMKHPQLNPSGNTKKHGPFAAFVGADAASIWAAATSGGPAIAIHLLGCLLARSFSDPTKSISTLVELVHERQQKIKSEATAFASTAAHMAALMAAEQPIERDELQQWDTSARAWLQTADSAMKKEYIQLRLILQNVSLPVTSASTLYEGVIRAWTQAMSGLERLLNGESQSVTDGAILLAISAWHLYPNLLVLGRESTNVDFGDRGVRSSGLLTVGITNAQNTGGQKEGIYWSMALSHYRYYGRALTALGHIDDRFTIDQLHLVALGSLLGSWNVPRKGIESAARWIIALEEFVSRAKKWRGCPSWIALLSKAARDIFNADRETKKEALALVDFGQRRGTNFLGPRNRTCLPWFGLRFRHIAEALAAGRPMDCAIEYLRHIANAGGLRYDEALITCITNRDGANKAATIHQYFTAQHEMDHVEVTNNSVPSLQSQQSPSTSANKGKSKTHHDSHRYSPELIPDLWLLRHNIWVGTFVYPDYDRSRKGVKLAEDGGSSFNVHVDPVGADGDLAANEAPFLSHGKLPIIEPMETPLIGRYLPAALQYQEHSHDSLGGLMGDCDALLPHGLGWFPSSHVLFHKFIGQPEGTIRLWLAQGRAVDQCDEFKQMVQALQSGKSAELLDIDATLQLMDERGGLDPLLVWNYLDGTDPHELGSATKEVLGLMRTEREKFALTVKSLKNLEVATNIYNRLGGATISSSLIETGLSEAEWAEAHSLPRSLVFSCIAMMETGKIKLDAKSLEQVIALSSGNSLFVSTKLLTDPYDHVLESSVTRIVGNVGRPGVNLLIPPAASPLTRSLSASFRAVEYANFDGKREDHFKGTTLHLSFTSHKFPLDYGVTGIIDHQVFFVESVISIHDSGQWVADLDILEALRISSDRRVRISQRPRQKPCSHPEGTLTSVLDGMTSIDSWEEVLDTNPGVNIIRAHKNWPARLAASVMLSKSRKMVEDGEEGEREDFGEAVTEDPVKNDKYSILENGDDVCWVCLHRRLSKAGKINATGTFYIIA